MAENNIKKNFLIISGEPNSGKTTIIYNLTDWLLKKNYGSDGGKNKEIKDLNKSGANPKDVCDILVNRELGKVVLVNGPTDDKECIEELTAKFKDLIKTTEDLSERSHTNYDCTIITSCRHILEGTQRKKLCERLPLTPKDNSFYSNGDEDVVYEFPLVNVRCKKGEGYGKEDMISWYRENTIKIIEHLLEEEPFNL